MTTLKEAHGEAYPPQVSTALFGLTKAFGQANCKANPPQVSKALFGLTAVFGSTTGGKTQGKTGQGISAADFLPATTAGANFQGKTGQGVSAADFFPQGHQYKKEAEAHGVLTRGRQNDKEAGAHDVRGSSAGAATNRTSDEDSYNMADASVGYVVYANLKAMRDLADNRSIRGTSASRMAADAKSAAVAPGWTGVGADYAAWLQDLWEDPTNRDAAITDGAPEWVYLVVMNRGTHMSVIHHLFRWKAPDGGRSCLDGHIVAFEGEILDAHGLTHLWRFAEEEEKLLQLRPLSADVLEYATMFYRDGDRDDEFHNRQTPPLGGHRATVQTCQRLIPIPVGWTHMFLDDPHGGSIPLAAPAAVSNSKRSRTAPVLGIRGRGCSGLRITRPNGTQPNQCRRFQLETSRVRQGDPLSGHRGLGRPPARSIQSLPPPEQNREHPPSLTTYLAGQRGRKMVLKPGGTVGGTAGPTPHPPTPAPTARRHQCPHQWHQCPHRQQCQGVWT